MIDATGRIVMPGFIDTHHHQFETALRSFLADGILINDGSGSPSGTTTYYEYILLKFAPGVPAAGRLHQRAVRRARASSTTASRRCTTSRRSITRRSTRTPRSRRCSIPGAAPPSAISRARAGVGVPGNQYPHDAFRIKNQWFSSSDQLVHMIMGGEVYLGPGTHRPVLDDRAPARPADRGAHPLAVRHPPDLRRRSPPARAATATSGSGRTTCSST